MNQKLQNIQTSNGATFQNSIPVSFGNDTQAIEATKQGVALYDRSHWGLIQISDDDRLRFLHNQSTNNFNILQPGQGCETVFITPTARTIDLATAYVAENNVLLLVSPVRCQQLIEWFDRYIFPMDKVEVKDVRSEYAIFSLIGVEGKNSIAKLAGTTPPDVPDASHQLINMGNIEVRVAVGSGLATEGYTLIVPVNNAAEIWQMLIEVGAVPMGDRLWEQLRIQEGRPAPDYELTDDYNPLEAGLWNTISFEKGCYIGQEIIARLNTYKGVRKRLWGVRLNGKAELGNVVQVGDEKVGKLTSFTETNDGYFGLVYIRTKAGGVGLKVQVGDVEGEVVEVPFLTHQDEVTS
ncbi:MAG: folate-binding protein YgfZ [Okeania sp. SIO3I5]|uniref:CAF17-like 4Fe-4S cluster assembly/insertion protein YgfZ n=1 Tax=Okeania sp. SIO3I5 TaxID=2607805 RepID=UPI0013BB32BD|nr:folate-binding protein [Okeania sp. SIO3I5]NEQ36941.1 folate-binding protein YgfZ [Okeania sp. SIO3I5]